MRGGRFTKVGQLMLKGRKRSQPRGFSGKLVICERCGRTLPKSHATEWEGTWLCAFVRDCDEAIRISKVLDDLGY